ncbi:NADPH oxidase organizer 1-like [Spinachia spinachia]
MAAERRFPFSARVIGAVQRDTPKLKMFMISVLWSDETDVLVYRSFNDFKELHKQLKKRFQHMNTLKNNERVIPKYRWRARTSLQQKGSQRSVQRMKFLETYCDQLLKCDHTVTQSSEVAHFFLPKDHDLQADFTKNSVIMLLTDDLPGGAGGADVRRQQAGSVTQPFVSQTYRCVAAYETKDTSNRPFKVAVDEELEVLIKDPAGWWLVENENKLLAWFPAPYLELRDQEGGDHEDDDEFPLTGALYCAVRSYSSQKEDEVSVPIGSVVEVLRRTDDGWWFIRFNGKSGYIPSMNLQPHNHPLHSLERKLHSSTLNLATSWDLHAPRAPRAPQPQASAAQSTGRLQKARSLDIIPETPPQSTSGGRERSMTAETNFPSSVGSSSPTGGPAAPLQGSSSPNGVFLVRRGSNTSSYSSGSACSSGSETSLEPPRVPPRVPARPKTEEILTRCSTMTREAALASRTRLQIQTESVRIR